MCENYEQRINTINEREKGGVHFNAKRISSRCCFAVVYELTKLPSPCRQVSLPTFLITFQEH